MTRRIMAFSLGILFFTAGTARAVTGTWTNYVAGGNLSGYWTNNSSWAPATAFPGTTADNAFLTNQVALAYTNILNARLNSSISTLAISNALGEAWLIVTNTVLTNSSTFVLGSGGRLRIDNGGVVTGITTVTWLGGNGVISINEGGKLFTSGAHTIGAAGGVTGLVTSVDGIGGIWNRQVGALTIGGASGNDNILRINNGVVVTNVSTLAVSGSRNSLLVSGGAKIFGAGAISIGTASNTITFGDGFWVHNNTALTIGGNSNTFNILGGVVSNAAGLTIGNAPGSDFNRLIVTDGGRLILGVGNIKVGSTAAGAAGGSDNTVILSDSFLSGAGGGSHYVGFSSSNNSLTLLNQSVWNGGGQFALVGWQNATNNAVIVNNSSVTNFAEFQIGASGKSVSNRFLIVNNSRATMNLLRIGVAAGDNFNSVIVSNNSQLNLANSGIILGTTGSTGNTLVVTDGSKIFGGGAINFGSAANTFIFGDGLWIYNATALTIGGSSNTLDIRGGMVSNAIGFVIGNAPGSDFNRLIVTNGGRLVLAPGYIKLGSTSAATGGAGGSFNTVVLSNSVLSSSSGGNHYIGYTSSNNSLTLLDQTSWNGAGQFFVIGTSSATNNSMTVSGAVLTNFAEIQIGVGSSANNRMLVTDNGQVSMNAIKVGLQSGDSGNNVTITNGGYLHIVNAVTVGATGANSNSLLVTDGGVLQAQSLLIGGIGNTISNRNGTFQFINTPTAITVGGVFINDGTISFRGTGAANVSTNAANLLRNIRYAGANTFTLNNASNTAATVSQTYTFDTMAGNPSNFVRLVMVNGTTAYLNANGANLTIGSGGSMLVSNTTATFGGLYTNAGVAQFVDSTASFSTLSHVTGISRLANSTLNLAGLSGSGVLSNDAGNSAIVSSGGNATFGGNLRGQGLSFTLSSGTQTLTGNNSYDGATTVNGGTLAFANASGTGLAFSTVSVNGGNLVISNSGGTAVDADITINSGTARFSNSGGTGLASGRTLTIAGGTTVTTTNSGGTAIAGNVLNSGLLNVNNSGSGISIAGTTTINGGRLTGNGTITGSVTFSGTGTLSPGNVAGNLGTLTIGSLTLSSASALDYELVAGSGNDFIAVTGANGLTINGGSFRLLQPNQNPFDTAGLYTLLSYNGNIGGTGVDAFNVSNPTANRTYRFGSGGGLVTLTIGGTGVGWNPGSLSTDSYWSNAQNWNAGDGPAPVAFDPLLFDGFTKNVNTNDFAAHTRFLGFSFTNSAGSFVLRGNTVNLLGDIVTLATNQLQTVELGVVLEGGNHTLRTVANSSLTMSGGIGETNASLGLIKAGAGLVSLTGTNTYTGTTEIQGGTLRANDGEGLPVASNLKFNGGVLETSGTFTRALGTTAGAVQWTSSGGFSAAGGSLTVNLNGGTPLTWGQGNFVPNGSTLTFGSATADHDVFFMNAIDLNGVSRTFHVTSQSATMAGTLSNGGLTKTGAGKLVLSANNTYTGDTIVNGGTLLVNGRIAAGGALTLASGTTLGGTGVIARTLSGAGMVAPGNSPGVLTAGQVDPTSGMDFSFEFTSLNLPSYTSFNDVLRLTNGAAFTADLDFNNVINLYVDAPLVNGITNVFRGGFYADFGGNFDGRLSNATFVYHGTGTLAFVRTVANTAYTAGGYVMEFGVTPNAVIVVPEPNVLLLCLFGLITLWGARRRAREP